MNDIKTGAILQSYGDCKYIIFTTKSLGVLTEPEEIGRASTYKEACRLLTNFLKRNGHETSPYWRLLMDETGTFIDYGSWINFAAIVPPVPKEIITGEVEES